MMADQPVILKDDDDTYSTDDEAEVDTAATFRDIHASKADRDASPRSTRPTQDPTSELSMPADPPSFERWYDFEDDRYVYEELPPSPGLGEQGSLISTFTQQDYTHSLHHSSRPSQDQINQHDDRITPSISEAAPHSLPEPLDNGGQSYDNVSELEEDRRLGLEEQEKSPLAGGPRSPPPCRSNELPYPQADPEHDQGGTSLRQIGGARIWLSAL